VPILDYLTRRHVTMDRKIRRVLPAISRRDAAARQRRWWLLVGFVCFVWFVLWLWWYRYPAAPIGPDGLPF
jgi:hypothetical protein